MANYESVFIARQDISSAQVETLTETFTYTMTDGAFSFTPTSPVANGTTLSVTATDAAGNTSEPATTTVDALAPATPTVAATRLDC